MPRSNPNAPALTEYISTRWYRAPEVLLRDPKYSTQIDIFAVGCVMAEMLALKPLFPGSSEIDQIHRVFNFLGQPTYLNWPEGAKLLDRMKLLLNLSLCSNGNSSLLGSAFDSSLKNLVQALPMAGATTITFLHKLLSMNPSDRPPAKDLVNDVYFSSTQDESNVVTGHNILSNNTAIKANGSIITTSPPYLEAEAMRQKRRNNGRAIPCNDKNGFPSQLSNNLVTTNSNGHLLATDLDYQYQSIPNQPIHADNSHLNGCENSVPGIALRVPFNSL